MPGKQAAEGSMVLLELRGTATMDGVPAPDSQRGALSVIEAAYDLGADDGPWLRGVLAALHPLLDRGLGVFGFFYEASDDWTRFGVSLPCFSGCPDNLLETLSVVTPLVPAHGLKASFTGPPCLSMSQTWHRLGVSEQEFLKLDFVRRVADATGAPDQLVVNAWELGTRGCAFAALLPGVQRFPARTASLLNRTARHIGAAP
jgi:hypothetical protein